MIDSISDQTEKIKKIEAFLNNFNLSEVKKKRNAKRLINQNLIELRGNLKLESRDLESINKSVKILDQVPCGNQFPSCKFIKNSHKNRLRLEKQEEKVTFISVKIDDIEEQLNKLTDNFEEKIEKYNTVLNKKSQMVDEISDKKIIIERTLQNIGRLEVQLSIATQEYENTQVVFNAQKESDHAEIYSRINQLEKALKHCRSSRDAAISRIASWRAKRDLYKKNWEEYDELNTNLRMYDMLIQAHSKRGIPVQLLYALLPKINSEISKILQGVVNFTIELEADLDSNAMDIYINYGDSRRIVELASGMEKMMASLAIRVALINISTLPKTNMLIIDEGFGALDETNLESCGKLLSSFKKWFRNIIIISHIDAIKDIVDNSIEITKEGVDSNVYQP
jgi:exonuclease SbcC